MRAIDGDALSEWLKDYGQKVIKGERKISLMYVWKHIQDMPTIEPERKNCETCRYDPLEWDEEPCDSCTGDHWKSERKTGKWIKKSKRLDFCTEWWYECSECGSKPPRHPSYLTDFCPNCGADMRGEQP